MHLEEDMRKSLGMAAVLAAVVVGPALRAEDTTQELLDKAIKAHGGAELLNKYKAATVKTKGKLFLMGKAFDFTGELSSELPDRLREEMTIEVMGQKVPTVSVLNKGKGWISAAGKTIEMPKDMLEEARQELHGFEVSQLTPLKGKDYKLTPSGESKVGGRPALGLRVTRKGYRDTILYFDKKTHLVVKLETRAKDLMGGGKEVTSETYFEDYKPVKGLQQPHRIVQKRDGKDYITGAATDIKVFEKLNDSVFAKPRADQ
jgi:hypothetical protein